MERYIIKTDRGCDTAAVGDGAQSDSTAHIIIQAFPLQRNGRRSPGTAYAKAGPGASAGSRSDPTQGDKTRTTQQQQQAVMVQCRAAEYHSAMCEIPASLTAIFTNQKCR